MPLDIMREVEILKNMTITELCEKHQEVFGEPARSRHKIQLWRRIAWRLQAMEEGGLSERARQRAEELANEADLRVVPPKRAFTQKSKPAEKRTTEPLPAPVRDPRLPPIGSVITKLYKGTMITVTVIENGFGYDEKVYRSLSGIAKTITGSHINGFSFFGLAR